jgi:hypothetical protein
MNTIFTHEFPWICYPGFKSAPLSAVSNLINELCCLHNKFLSLKLDTFHIFFPATLRIGYDFCADWHPATFFSGKTLLWIHQEKLAETSPLVQASVVLLLSHSIWKSIWRAFRQVETKWGSLYLVGNVARFSPYCLMRFLHLLKKTPIFWIGADCAQLYCQQRRRMWSFPLAFAIICYCVPLAT